MMRERIVFNREVGTSLVLTVFSLIVYTITLAPTISWGDSSDLAQRIIKPEIDTAGFNHSTRDYDLFRIISRFFQLLPYRDQASAANFASAFFGALTIGLVTYLTSLLSKSLYAGLVSGLTLTFAHTFWLLSVIAEVYTFTTFLIFMCFVLLTRWILTGRWHYLYFSGLFSGLLISHSPSGLVGVVCLIPYAWISFHRLKSVKVVFPILLFAVSSIFYLDLVKFRLKLDLGLLETLAILPPENLMHNHSILKDTVSYFGYFTYNFAGFAFIFFLFGVIYFGRNLSPLFLPPVIFSFLILLSGITSSIPDKYNIYVLTYPSFAMIVGFGFEFVRVKFKLQRNAVVFFVMFIIMIPPLTYFTVTKVSSALKVDLTSAREAPFRNNNEYFLWPPKNEDYGARYYATRALTSVSFGGVLLVDYTLYMPIIYLQEVEDFRTDVEVLFIEQYFEYPGGISKFVEHKLQTSRIFLGTNQPESYYRLKELRTSFRIRSEYPIFELSK
jgi:hypothetical protein